MKQTLGYHRKNAAVVFGEESPAVKFLDKKIAEQGEDAEIFTSEGQVIHLLMRIHRGEAQA